MEQVAEDVQARLERLESAVLALNTRLTAIETGVYPEPEGTPDVWLRADPVAAADPELKHPMLLMGKSVLILGGAFLLRALTESQILPAPVGVALALLYATAWIVIAHRAARQTHPGQAIFECAAGAVIAFPMIFETTARFRMLAPEVGSALTLAVSVLLLWVGRRNEIRSVALIAIAGGSVTFIALAGATESVLPAALGATLLGAISITLVRGQEWSYEVWPAVAVSDVLTLALLAQALVRRRPHAPGTIVAALLLFAFVWYSAVVLRRLLSRTEPALLEVAQLVEVTLAGVLGALVAAALLGAPVEVAATFGLTFGAMLLAAAFAAARRALPELAALCSGVGALALLLGSAVLLGGHGAAVLWALLGAAAAFVVRRSGSRVAMVHSAAWLIAAAIASGMPLALATSFSASSRLTLTLPILAVALGGATAYAAYLRTAGASVARLTALAIAAVPVLILAMAVGVASLAAESAAVTAIAGTAVLSLLAALLALFGRLDWLPDAGLVARALLAAGGLKLLLQDIRVLNAALLVISFAIYGCAMMIVARKGSPQETVEAVP